MPTQRNQTASKAQAIPTVVGTSTPWQNVHAVMATTNLTKRFHYIATAEDVDRSNPHPDVFLEAVLRIERKPSQRVVIEDALVDIQAAKAGGIWVLAAANTHSEHFLTDTDDVHTSPTTVTVETLQTLIHG